MPYIICSLCHPFLRGQEQAHLFQQMRTILLSREAFLGQTGSSQISSIRAAMEFCNQVKAGSAHSHLIWGRQDLAELKEGGSKLAEKD